MKIKVLVVEDEIIIAEDLKARLKTLGYDVLPVASTADEVRASLAEEIPGIVLMDIRLGPSGDGITLAEEIRDRFDLPVIFVTAFTDEEILERAKRANPYGYIVKPVKDTVLRSVLEVVLHKHAVDRRFRMLFRTIPSGVLLFGRERPGGALLLRDMNPAASRRDERGRDAIGNSLEEYLGRFDAAELISKAQGVLETGTPASCVVTLRAEDGRLLAWREYFVYRQEEGEIVLVFREATEEKRLEETLRRRTNDLSFRVREVELLHSILKAPLSREALQGQLLRVADALPSLLRFPEIGAAEIVADGERYACDRFFPSPWSISRPIVAGGRTKGNISLIYREQRNELYEGPFSRDEVDLLEHVCAAIGDILALHDARRREEDARELFASVMDSLEAPVAIVDGSGSVIGANAAFENLAERSIEEAEGLSIDRVLPGVWDADLRQAFADFVRGSGFGGGPASLPTRLSPSLRIVPLRRRTGNAFALFFEKEGGGNGR